MIDFEKLKTVHELAEKLANETECSINVSIVHYDNSSIEFELRDSSSSFDFENFMNIDDLITKLQELTKKEPKFKIGDIVWWMSGNIPTEGFYTPSKKDAHLYPTKESLINAQIEYWSGLKDDGNILKWKYQGPSLCQHESNGMSYTSNPPQNKCIKCEEFYK